MSSLLTAKAPADATTEAIAAAFDASGGDTDLAALALWYAKESELLTNPAKWSAVADYSQDTSVNLTHVANKIRRLEAAVGLSAAATGGVDENLGGLSVGYMHVNRRGRRGGRRNRSGRYNSAGPLQAPPTVTATETIRARLDAISAAIAATVPITHTFADLDIVADVPLTLDAGLLFSSVTSIEVFDGDGQLITEGITAHNNFPTVDIVSGITLNNADVHVIGLPA